MSDSQALFLTTTHFANSGRLTLYDTHVFRLATQTTFTIIQNAVSPFLYGYPNLLTIVQNGRQSVQLVNGDGTQNRVLVLATDNVFMTETIGLHTAVAIWQTNNRFHLSWIDISGGDAHQLDETADSLRTEYGWARDKWLFYTGLDQGNSYIAKLNFATGAHVRLIEHLKQIVFLYQDSGDDDLVHYWTKTADGHSAIYTYRLDGGVSQVNPITTTDLELEDGSLYWSPNREQAILRASSTGGQALYLLSQPNTSLSMISGSGTPFEDFGTIQWSPDGTMFAFVQGVDTRYARVEVYAANGSPIRRIGTFPSEGVAVLGMGWTVCQ